MRMEKRAEKGKGLSKFLGGKPRQGLAHSTHQASPLRTRQRKASIAAHMPTETYGAPAPKRGLECSRSFR